MLTFQGLRERESERRILNVLNYNFLLHMTFEEEGKSKVDLTQKMGLQKSQI